MIPYSPPQDDMRFLLNDLEMLPRVAALPGFEDADAELPLAFRESSEKS